MILFAIHSMAWERVSTQLDIANNADPNKAVYMICGSLLLKRITIRQPTFLSGMMLIKSNGSPPT